MQFSTDRSTLLAGLQRVYGVVPARSTLPLLQNILVVAGDSGLELTATDLEVSIRTTLPIQISEHGGLAIPARLFYEVVRELPETEIRFVSEGLELVAQTERGVYRFPGIPVQEFPAITVKYQDEGIRFPAQVLARMISKASFAVSDEPLRLALTGVLFHFHENVVDFVSTDGRKLVKIRRTDIHHEYENTQVILPTKALNLYLRNVDSANEAVLYLVENHVVFDLDNTVIYAKQIAAKYPNYERVIPTDNPYRLAVSKEELTSAARRVSVFASSLGKAIFFQITRGKLALSAEDIQYGGQAYEEIPADYDGPEIGVSYNAQFILEILKHIDTDTVHFLLRDEQTGTLVVPSVQQESEELIALVMPIRMTETEEA